MSEKFVIGSFDPDAGKVEFVGKEITWKGEVSNLIVDERMDALQFTSQQDADEFAKDWNIGGAEEGRDWKVYPA